MPRSTPRMKKWWSNSSEPCKRRCGNNLVWFNVLRLTEARSGTRACDPQRSTFVPWLTILRIGHQGAWTEGPTKSCEVFPTHPSQVYFTLRWNGAGLKLAFVIQNALGPFVPIASVM